MVRIFQDANPTRNSLSTRGLCDPPSLAQDREKLHALAAPLRTLPERPRPQEPNDRTENGSLPDPFSPPRRLGWHSAPSLQRHSVLLPVLKVELGPVDALRANARLLSVTNQAVPFRWKDRAHQNRSQSLTLPGVEFVRRYMRHVLPRGLRSVRYYGFCHPTAKASRLRVQLHSGTPLDLGRAPGASDSPPALLPEHSAPLCRQCGQPMPLLLSIHFRHRNRGPPPAKRRPLLTGSAP